MTRKKLNVKMNTLKWNVIRNVKSKLKGKKSRVFELDLIGFALHSIAYRKSIGIFRQWHSMSETIRSSATFTWFL